MGHVLAVDDDAPGLGGPQPREHLDQLGLAVALHPGDADDLPGAHLETHVMQGALTVFAQRGQPLHVEHDRVRRGRPLLHREDDLAAHHQGRQRVLRSGLGVGFTGDAAIAQHDDAVGDLQHFLELVGNKDDGFALPLEQVHHLEQSFDLLRR